MVTKKFYNMNREYLPGDMTQATEYFHFQIQSLYMNK